MSEESLVLFDLDGVLLDSETDLSWLETSIKKTLIHFQIPITKENLCDLHFKNIDQFRSCSLKLGVDPEVLWPVRNKFYVDEKLKAMKQRIITPFSDVQEIYSIQKKYRIGIISNSPQIIVDSFVSLFEFSDLFTLNIGRGDTLFDIEHLKPDPYLYDKVRIHTDVELITYIGDRQSDREFAEKTHMRYYHLNRFDKQADGFTNLTEIIEILQQTT